MFEEREIQTPETPDDFIWPSDIIVEGSVGAIKLLKQIEHVCGSKHPSEDAVVTYKALDLMQIASALLDAVELYDESLFGVVKKEYLKQFAEAQAAMKDSNRYI